MTQVPQLRPLGPALGTEALGIELGEPPPRSASSIATAGASAMC